ncbi:MAG: carbohydrate ABC transporter permease [Truepera sp.]|nr:carbohydrate ABC transporter permease [Truepera sp.]
MKVFKSWWKRGYGLTLLSILMLSVFLFPIYWMLATSVRPVPEILAYPPQIFPSRIDWTSWERIFNTPAIPRYFLNSAIVGLGTTLLSLALATPAAYALAHLAFRGKPLLVLIGLSSLMFPAIMVATPLFVIFSRLGLTDSHLGLILANTALALPFVMVVLRPFFLTLPSQLAEAAKIDGCGEWGAFLRVMLPLATPAIATASIFTFLFGWNDLVFALSLTSSDAYRPVTAGLWRFVDPNAMPQWGQIMAFSTLAMLPPLIVFLMAQRHVISGLTAGGIKQ